MSVKCMMGMVLTNLASALSEDVKSWRLLVRHEM